MRKIILLILLLISLFIMTDVVFANVNDKNNEKAVEEKNKDEEKSNQFIIINKAYNKLAFYEDGKLVKMFSVATGKHWTMTPLGSFEVTVKWECPVYYKTKKGGCDPTNPLGPRWIGLDVPGTWGYTYGIHGNNNASSIGTYASAGCVRMHNWQVLDLFNVVKMNTPVVIVNEKTDFKVIAEKNGYAVRDFKKVGKELELLDSLNKYYGANKGFVLREKTKNVKVEIIKKMDNWLHVKDSNETYWINSKEFANGEGKEINKYLLAQSELKLYELPYVKSDYIKLNYEQIVYSKEVIGEWHYVRLTNDFEGWIKLNEANEMEKENMMVQKIVERSIQGAFQKVKIGNVNQLKIAKLFGLIIKG